MTSTADAIGSGTRQRAGSSTRTRMSLRVVALAYLGLLVAAPFLLMTWSAFADGLGPVIDTLTDRAFVHALKLTLLILFIAVPLTTIFGIACALVVVRQRFRGKALFDALLALPLGVSPVVVGLSLILVYGARSGWLGPWFMEHGIRIIFSTPAMVLATIFVTIPFVAREVIPVLREIGTDQEQAASILGATPMQTFWMVTLPAIRTGVAYGVVLTAARALGEYGAVAVVSGKLAGRTETLTLHVEERWLAFDPVSAYTTSLVLAAMAIAVLIIMRRLTPKEQ
ncbi:MAG: sulfate ABC transporter permease [Chloroflexota bacterium]